MFKTDFKQTEGGLIPQDWTFKLLPEVCKFRSGKAHEQFVSEFGKYVCVNSKFISSNGQVKKYTSANFCPAKKNDIMMVMSDLPNGKALAKAFVADKDDLYAVNQRVCTLTPYRDNAKYIFYALNRNPYFLKFDDGVNQTHLLNPVFMKCPVVLPCSVEEQQDIACALTDADALIHSLEQLLTKKRQIKQGAMQELLTGKRRLPGFASTKPEPVPGPPNDWMKVAIGDIAEVKTGPFGSALHERDYVQSGTPIITVEHLGERGIQGDGAPQVGDQDVARLQAYKLQEGDIVFSRVGSIDRNARVSANEEGWLFSGRLLRLRPKTPDIESQFLSYLFHAEPFRRQVERVAVGQTMASLNTKLLSSLEIMVPIVHEQRAIADALSAMDAEIESLESRLTKARALKQAMAQALLTGRIRLVEPTA